jgi:hypothetical protein
MVRYRLKLGPFVFVAAASNHAEACSQEAKMRRQSWVGLQKTWHASATVAELGMQWLAAA